MSVTDPLLKNFKSYAYRLCTVSGPVTDNDSALQPFCQMLELILRKGLRQSSSVFELSKLRDYWHWIEHLSLQDCTHSSIRKHPLYDVIFQRVCASAKVTSNQGRGRLFLRESLQSKLIVNVVELLVANASLLHAFYDPTLSIMGNEILFEIFKSVLMQVNELTFDLCISNHSFLDDTWKLSVYKELQFVPCRDLGIQLYHTNGRALVTSLDKGSVAEDSGDIEVGDILDEIFDKALRNVVKGAIPKLLKCRYGQPVTLAVVKARDADGCIFPPIGELIKTAGMSLEGLCRSSGNGPSHHSKRRPPHALLPDEFEDEVPVHGVNDVATYYIQFVGKLSVGESGGIEQVDPAILHFTRDDRSEPPIEATMDLSETEVVAKKRDSDELLMKLSYTEVSSCGRRNDHPKYFAYIAGDTTCTLSKNFTAFVFRAASDEDSKTIICAIAQGFSRTHWFV